MFLIDGDFDCRVAGPDIEEDHVRVSLAMRTLRGLDLLSCVV